MIESLVITSYSYNQLQPICTTTHVVLRLAKKAKNPVKITYQQQVWLLRPLFSFSLFSMALSAQAQKASDLNTRTIYSQDFESTTPGNVLGQSRPNTLVGAKLPDGIHDDTYAGTPPQVQVVRIGNNNALEIATSGFTQVVLGELEVHKDRVYRISADVQTRGAQSLTFTLRRIPSPYTGYISSTEKANEAVRHVEFVGRAPAEDNTVGLFLNLTAFTTVTVDNIKVEELQGDVPPPAPPKAGNLVPNSGFEGGRDGWFLRGVGTFPASSGAFEGRRVARMKAVPNQQMILSSSWFGLVPGYEYLIRTRIRAVSDTAGVGFGVGSTRDNPLQSNSQVVGVSRAEGWKTVQFRYKVPQPLGKFADVLQYNAFLEGREGESEVDALEVRPIGDNAQIETTPYLASASKETGVFTDATQGVTTVGEPVRVSIVSNRSDGPLELQIRDESDQITHRMTVALRNGEARATLPKLPPGAWHLWIPAGEGSSPGENFVLVVPKMPDVPASQWFHGGHVIDDAEAREAAWKLGFHWDRLHDTCVMTKWPTVQPDSNTFNFQDEELRAHTANGQQLLGSLDGFPSWLPKLPLDAKGEPIGGDPSYRDFTRFIDWDKALPLWAQYCQRTVDHFRGITYWEVTNEPNFVFTPQLYMRLLSVAAPAIRSANPQAKVVGPSVGGNITDSFLRDVFKLGAGRYLDVVTYHGYAGTTYGALNGPNTSRQQIADFRAFLKSNGDDPNVPIWDGESGAELSSAFLKFQELSGAVSPQLAERTFAAMALCAPASGMGRHLYYALFTPSVADEINQFGMGDVNSSTKIAFQPFAVAVSLIEGRQFVRDASANGTIHLIYRGRGATVQALWRPQGTARIAVPADTTRIINMFGRDLKPARTLIVGEQVTYLVAR